MNIATSLFKDAVTITGYYGAWVHPITGLAAFHKGIDLGAYLRELFPAADGTVEYTGWDNEGGNWILIKHNDGTGSRYFHLSRISVKVGDKVKKGKTLLGITGNTGNGSTGYHLHFEYLLNWKDRNTHTNPLSFITEQPMAVDKRTIQVQAGWGLSNVAQAVGLPANEQSYQLIYELNAGWRGSTNWEELNARMGPGDILVVSKDYKGDIDPKVTQIENEKKELEKQLAEKQKEYEATLASYRAEAENTRNSLLQQVEALTNKIVIYEQELMAARAELPKLDLSAQDLEIVEDFKLSLRQKFLVLIHNVFEFIPAKIRPMAYLASGAILVLVSSYVAGFDWTTWATENPGGVATLVAMLVSTGLGNEILFMLKRAGEDLKEEAYSVYVGDTDDMTTPV